MDKLLTRDQFREQTFARDNYKCVFCDSPAVDAHHIMERRLFSDSGYYLNNGASVCEKHHLLCEQTVISLEEVRDACGITKAVIPSHMYQDQQYDKWGNPVMPNGTRLKGELFYDESVQKILKIGGVLDSFTHLVKYPRTYHMSFSPGMTDDDRMIPNMSAFEGKRVILSVKFDGENTSMYTGDFHARSVDSKNHPSRNWAKRIWSQICGDIPAGWRICAENLYAQHSIAYNDLPSYLLAFSVWNDLNVCLDWDTSLEWFDMLSLDHVEVAYDGIYDEKIIRKICESSNWETCEGFVLRTADSFHYGDFKKCVAKYVRKGHVQPSAHHWQRGETIPNKLKED